MRKSDGKQVMRIEVQAGFDWTESVKPILPGNPDWCPSSHFGYLESGSMDILMEDETTIHVKAGETYFIPPGHRPEFNEDTIMIEFTQDTTYTNKSFVSGASNTTRKLLSCWLCGSH